MWRFARGPALHLSRQDRVALDSYGVSEKNLENCLKGAHKGHRSPPHLRLKHPSSPCSNLHVSSRHAVHQALSSCSPPIRAYGRHSSPNWTRYPVRQVRRLRRQDVLSDLMPAGRQGHHRLQRVSRCLRAHYLLSVRFRSYFI